MNRDTVRQATNVLAYVAMIVVNGLANTLPLNGQTTGEISDRFQVYSVPAGYVFSIWGLIYLLLLGFAIYQALPAQRENPRLRRVGYLFALSSLFNIIWIFLWHYDAFVLTLVAMGGLLLTLIAIYLRLDINRTVVSRRENWLVEIPFSVYLGWITVATVANVTVVLDYLKWGGWGIRADAWAVIMLVVGAAITLAVVLTRGDVAYTLVILWAYAGIAVRQAGVPVVATAAWVMAVLVALLVPLAWWRGKKLARA